MSRSIRIRTTPNSDEKYVKVKLEQDFDLLEILSLKITQEDAYQSFCANYGVVAGRISINDGFGVPNVKVSIFVPITEGDKENAIIREIYPYETTGDKNRNGLRYNLLPNRKQHTDHTPIGGFPEKREVLDDETFIEVYEKYYKYTTKTNESGDFMLFGVPNGQQQLFYDLDVSDIGFLSARPYELIAQGYPESGFQDKFTFKEGGDINQLTQVRSATIPIFVKPFWCDTLNLGQEIGVTRQDIPIDDYELKPTAIFMGGLFSDDEKDSVNKNCRPRKKMGQMNELITGEGNIEIIRRTQQGDIEFYKDLGDDLIDENGNWSFQVPMNLRKVITAEDGTLIPSPNGIKGVATEADVRFRLSMDKSNDAKRLRTRAKMLVPNMTGNYTFDGFDRSELRDAEFDPVKDPIFEINDQISLTPNSLENDPANEYNYLKEFFTFRWKKVYTVRQYIGRFQPNKVDENRNFIGIKDITDGFGVNKMPFNRVDTNVNPLYSLLCFLLSVFGLLIAIVNGIINIINSFITFLCQVKIPIPCIILKFGGCDQPESNPAGCNTIINQNIIPCGVSLSGGGITILPPSLQLPSVSIKWRAFIFAICIKNYCFFSGLCNSCSNDSECIQSNGNNSCQNCCSGPVKLFNCDTASCDCPTGCCDCCCEKIPLITLKCPDGSIVGKPVALPTPFAANICNENQILPCLTCGGVDFTIIRDWVNCRLESIAAILGLIKFDFYNDWVNGSLYFPLIKRKYKVKKRKKKFGQIKKDKFCDFNCYNTTTNKYLVDDDTTLLGGTNPRKDDTDHGKPLYVEIEDEDLGFTQFVNMRGHAHHQNKCNKSYLLERKEFAKLQMDCDAENTATGGDSGFDTDVSELDPSLGCKNGCGGGVKGCSAFCDCDSIVGDRYYYGDSIEHGIVKYEEGEIYYASIITNDSTEFNSGYIKGNMMYPTNITELGSSTFCDIDDQPFIIDKLEPTSFTVSERPTKPNGKEPGSTINVTTYVDFGCVSTKCMSTKNTVMTSQIGIDILDVTDDGFEIQNPNRCGAFFDHDVETRSYFCKRFSPYVNIYGETSYQQPATVNRENSYETYPEITVTGLEDDDSFVPGDKCSVYNGLNSVSNGEYFYGMEHSVDNLLLTPTTLTDKEGVSMITTETPYYFYFGLVPGKTALHKTVGKFFADKIDEETLEGIDDIPGNNPTQPGGTPQSPASLLATCLNKS